MDRELASGQLTGLDLRQRRIVERCLLIGKCGLAGFRFHRLSDYGSFQQPVQQCNNSEKSTKKVLEKKRKQKGTFSIRTESDNEKFNVKPISRVPHTFL